MTEKEITYAQIHILNEEEDYKFELNIQCNKIDIEKVKQVIKNFHTIENRFKGCYQYIEELQKHGFSAQEVKYDIEI